MKSILKKVAGLAVTAALALGMMSCEQNVDTHEHTFATEWTSDATHHWHAATCGHTTEVKDKAEHTFGEWTVTLEPTEEAEGTKEKECSVCHYKVEEAIAKLDHVHTFAAEWTSDATHHWHAATCGHTTEVKDKTEHNFGEWNITTQPTEEAEGAKERECSICHYKAEETIAKLEHTHTFATSYSSDDTHHWHAATCGHTTEVKDKAEHTFGDPVIITEPSLYKDGQKKYTCSDCGYIKTEKIRRIGVLLTVQEFVEQLGSEVQYITANVSTPGITYDTSTKTANIYGVSLTGEFSSDCKLPATLKTADLTGISTSEVTSMSCMFGNCRELKSINISNFDTSNVTNMSYMFRDCRVLESINVSSFDTSNVTVMDAMFYDCRKLTSLDVTNFDTSNLESMKYMFSTCEKLTYLDLRNFNTQKVKKDNRYNEQIFFSLGRGEMANENLDATVYVKRSGWTLGTDLDVLDYEWNERQSNFYGERKLKIIVEEE